MDEECFELVEDEMNSTDIMKISNDFLESLSSIKVKGYVNVEEVEYPTLFIETKQK